MRSIACIYSLSDVNVSKSVSKSTCVDISFISILSASSHPLVVNSVVIERT